jgi:hypothetical protein
MQKQLIASLAPLVCLTVTASAARLFNHAQERATTPEEMPGIVYQQATPTAHREIEATLREIREDYRAGGLTALKEHTPPPSWNRWQASVDGKHLQRRMDMLASWETIQVLFPKVRPSGHVEVLVTGEGRVLKAWLCHMPDGWKLLGLVMPPTP